MLETTVKHRAVDEPSFIVHLHLLCGLWLFTRSHGDDLVLQAGGCGLYAVLLGIELEEFLTGQTVGTILLLHLHIVVVVHLLSYKFLGTVHGDVHVGLHDAVLEAVHETLLHQHLYRVVNLPVGSRQYLVFQLRPYLYASQSCLFLLVGLGEGHLFKTLHEVVHVGGVNAHPLRQI